MRLQSLLLCFILCCLGSLTYALAPAITSFTPSNGPVGTVVTINGSNFTGATAVTFNGANATSFTVLSAVKVTAVVATGTTTGKISVTTPDGTATSAGTFSFIPVPSITSFTPMNGPEGTMVAIYGTALTGATAVKINGVNAVYTVVNSAKITATVATGTTTGKITVTTAGGTAISTAAFIVAPIPTIASFAPACGPVGTVVTIIGANFSGATAVKFNGKTAASFTVVNSTTLTAVVAAGATSGAITVTTLGGTATSSTVFLAAPTITSFTPTSGGRNATVTINGSNFTGATAVKFNGTNAVSFTVVSAVKVSAVVAAGSTTGKISITTPGGTVTSAGTFSFIPAPTITSFTPTNGLVGSTVAIYGTTLTGATAVKINGVSAAYTVVNSAKIIATVASGTSTGKITLTTAGGTSTSTAAFTVTTLPTITSFLPTSGPAGTMVTIIGTNFSWVSAVKFNGKAAASFTVVNSTTITAVVAAGTTSGTITVTTLGGTATSATVFLAAPTITSFTPTSSGGNATVTINGSNFTGATAVKFNGTNAVSFTVVSAVKITAAVATGSTTGKISVTTPGGTAISAGSFSFVPAPVITSFTPTSGPVGTMVSIYGTALTGATAVKINGVNAAYTVMNSAKITATVASGTTTGKITVTTAGGTATSTTVFTVIFPPTISSFTPNNGATGQLVTLTGTNFIGTTAVVFNKTAATSMTVLSATSLTALVPSGASSGKISVTTPGGSTTSIMNFSVTTGAGSPGINPTDGAAMVWVPDGSFTMGTECSNTWVGPATQQVTLSSGYWIYKYEVTIAQYRAFCTATSRMLPTFLPEYMNIYPWKGTSGWADPTLQDQPMVNVNWYDAKAYANWARVQLPTEAQWEYADRGPSGNNYPWGGTATFHVPDDGWDASKSANWYNSYNVNKGTWPVGSFPTGASWCAAQDLSGNAMEWCADWFGDYSKTPVIDPTGPATGEYRAIRGGTWGTMSLGSRGADRGYCGPEYWGQHYGFRCVSLTQGPQ